MVRQVNLPSSGGMLAPKSSRMRWLKDEQRQWVEEGSEQQCSVEITTAERQGRVVQGLGQGSTKLVWDFLPGPVLPEEQTQHSKKPGIGGVSV